MYFNHFWLVAAVAVAVSYVSFIFFLITYITSAIQLQLQKVFQQGRGVRKEVISLHDPLHNLIFWWGTKQIPVSGWEKAWERKCVETADIALNNRGMCNWRCHQSCMWPFDTINITVWNLFQFLFSCEMESTFWIILYFFS